MAAGSKLVALETLAEPRPPIAFLCQCGFHIGRMEGRYLAVYREAVAYGEPASIVTRIAQPAPIICSHCSRERVFYPVSRGAI